MGIQTPAKNKLFGNFFIELCILFINFIKICIFFDKVIIKTDKYFFDCSGKVSLVHIRRGRSSNCGGFIIYGNIFNETGECIGLWGHSE